MKKALQKRLIRRLKIIEGQIRGLRQMIENNEYCVDIINQSLAARQAISAVENAMLENHLSTHVVEQMQGNQKSKAVSEIMDIYKLTKKK